MTVEEAAKILDVTVHRLQRKVRDLRIPRQKVKIIDKLGHERDTWAHRISDRQLEQIRVLFAKAGMSMIIKRKAVDGREYIKECDGCMRRLDKKYLYGGLGLRPGRYCRRCCVKIARGDVKSLTPIAEWCK